VLAEREGEQSVVNRRFVDYACPKSHTVQVPLHGDLTDAELPPTWDCPRHGTTCTRSTGIDQIPAEAPSQESGSKSTNKTKNKTEWDRLLERRTISELELILDERLEVLRANRQG
jgi:hypothetical protein